MTADQRVPLGPMSREELERHCKAMTDDRDGFYRIAERRRGEIERLRAEDEQWDKHSLVQIVEHRNKLRDAIQGIASRLLPGQNAMDMHFTRGDIDRLNALCSPADVTGEQK